MELRARIRLVSRRAAFATASITLFASALAGTAASSAHAAKKQPPPVITGVAPLDVAVGETLTVRGRNFLPGRMRNTVVFKRAGERAVFAKAAVSTAKMLRVSVPVSLQKVFAQRAGAPVPTRFRVRVLAKRFGRKFTSKRLSPRVSGPRPLQSGSSSDGDCDSDGVVNGVDADDDGDLLADDTERAIGTAPCSLDTDGDGVEDGYEYQSAQDLNDDEYQGDPNQNLPYPGKRPYPNPLFDDAGSDYDGDSLTLAEEQSLWKYTYAVNGTAARALGSLSYSDGTQHSIHNRVNGRRVPSLPVAGYARQQQFLDWATATGYMTVLIPVGPAVGYHDLRDVNMNNAVSASETEYSDYDGDGVLADDERDEDADGLTNFDETHGRATTGYWTACYKMETPHGIDFGGSQVDDADSDGDGVLDGADDQDHDDIPNLMELSRNRASVTVAKPLGEIDWQFGSTCRISDSIEFDEVDRNGDGKPDSAKELHAMAYGRVNPFNPCLPATNSRACTAHPGFSGVGAPFDDSPNWLSLQ